MTVFSDWSKRWFGFWKEHGERYSQCPSIQAFIDPDWNCGEIPRIIHYIQTAPVLATTSRIAIPWAIGDGDSRSTISYRSDGQWLWFDDLDYYILEHNLKIPAVFVEHITAMGFQPSESLDLSQTDLDEPPIGD